MGELWPSRLRDSGMGFVYGIDKFGKFIGPAGPALIAGSSNYVKPAATLDALVPGFLYFALWYVLGPSPCWLIGFETSRRSIEEIDDTLGRPATVGGASAAAHSAGD
jgi:putative MFS transporter